MSERPNFSAGDFAEYLQSVVQLNALEKMTQDLDKELADSQNVMMEIKALYNSACNVQDNRPESVNIPLANNDISNFFDTNIPDVLMPGMSSEISAVDIDHIIASIKTYVEDLKNNTYVPDTKDLKPIEFKNVDMEHYVRNLDQLSKRLTAIKVNKKEELAHRNIELEDKLTLFCDDVNHFITMIQAKTSLCRGYDILGHSESNRLQYNNIISKLLSGVNELTYMLQKKN